MSFCIENSPIENSKACLRIRLDLLMYFVHREYLTDTGVNRIAQHKTNKNHVDQTHVLNRRLAIISRRCILWKYTLQLRFIAKVQQATSTERSSSDSESNGNNKSSYGCVLLCNNKASENAIYSGFCNGSCYAKWFRLKCSLAFQFHNIFSVFWEFCWWAHTHTPCHDCTGASIDNNEGFSSFFFLHC